MRLPSTVLIALFVAFICAVIVVGESWRALGEQRIVLDQAERAMENLARSLAGHAEGTVELADAMVYSMVVRLEREGVSQPGSAEVNGSLAHRVAITSRLWSLSILDADGRLIASSLPGVPGQARVEAINIDRHREGERGPILGPVVREPASGIYVLTLSRRFDRPDGSFGGVAVAAIDVEYFARHYAQFDVGRSGVLALVSGNGLLFSRYPFDASLINNSLTDSPVYVASLTQPYGALAYPSRQDAIVRIGGHASAERFPLIGIAAVSRDEALAGWRHATGARLVVDGLVILVILALGLILMSHAHRREEMELQLAALARTDQVTGLANRRAFDAELARSWRRAARLGEPLSLLLIDLDHFKGFNDSYGHPSGDACLRAVGDALGAALRRPGDVVARYGGEEIAIILAGLPGAGAVVTAERARAAIEALAIPHAANPPHGVVTASIGLATVVPAAGLVPERLIAAADAALYDAKAGGRNRIAVSPGALLMPLTEGAEAESGREAERKPRRASSTYTAS